MAVIDFHIHLGNMYYKQNPYILQVKDADNKLYEDIIRNFTDDPIELENYLKNQGLDNAIVLPELHPFSDFNVSTEMVVDYCKNSNFFIPFAHFNPNEEKKPNKKLEYFINKLNCRGLKLLPSYHHFYPNDKHLYPLYEFAQENNLPVMYHIGSSTFPRTKLKYCDPFCLDELCADFPDLRVIACHGGRGFWYDSLFFMMKLHHNFFIDIAGLPPGRLLEFFPKLENKSDRFIFGSDWPTIPKSIKYNIDSIQKLPATSDCKENILYKNAQKLLRI